MSVHYVRDLPDVFRAIESIIDDIVEKETESLLNQVSELEDEVQELEAENESLLEYKQMYLELCK